MLYQEVEELFAVECYSVVKHGVLAEVVYVVVYLMQTTEDEPFDLSDFIVLHQLPFRRGEQLLRRHVPRYPVLHVDAEDVLDEVGRAHRRSLQHGAVTAVEAP